MLEPGYDIAKAAHAAAFFALKSGGRINVLKLTKLLYLAEREFMAKHDEPMFFDRLFSMPDGPVPSITLNLINGEVEHELWARSVGPRVGYDVTAAPGVDVENLDDLSDADREVLEDLWARFGRWDRYEIRDWTHVKGNVPEWEDPQGSSKKINYRRVFQLLGKQDPDSLSDDIEEYRRIHAVLSKTA